MTRRIDLGVSSFGSPDLLRRTLDSILLHSTTDWRVNVVDNKSPQSEQIYELVRGYGERTGGRVMLTANDTNTGYAGAVETIQKWAETEYVGYLDSDVEIQSAGWDETLCTYLDRFHEIGFIVPNGGAYPIDRGSYTEIMWGVGFCWVLNRLCMSDVGYFDTTLGHQEEADYAQRVRMAGWKCAAAKEVRVSHLARATNEQSPASIERISRGVVNFVNKWTSRFGGKNINYHSPNVIRWEDWFPQALYMEEIYQRKLPGLNANPEVVTINGVEYDLIRVPRLKGFYRNRVI